MNKKMKITISGFRIQNPRFVRFIRHSCRFFCKKLMEPSMLKRLHVKFRLVKHLVKKEDCYGSCIFEDSSYRPKKFLIQIDSCTNIRNITTTIAHELTHVSQFYRGHYKIFNRNLVDDTDDGIHRWKTKLVDTFKLEYDDYPWEKEAFRMEEKLFKSYELTKYWKLKHKIFKTISGRKKQS